MSVVVDRSSVSIRVPSDALVILIGPAGSGKTTFAMRSFVPDAVLSSDAFREMVSGDAADQSATDEAFRALHDRADGRLLRGLLTVVDATNLRFDARDPLLAMAGGRGRPAVAVVFDLPLERCLAWNQQRPGRQVPARALRRQHGLLRRVLPHLESEGFAAVHVLRGVHAVTGAVVEVGVTATDDGSPALAP